MKRSRSNSPASGSPAKKAAAERAKVALFVFRRDLRLADNTGFAALCEAAAARSIAVLPAFFFNPVQCDKEKNPYFGDAFFKFFCESLVDLDGPAQLDGRLVCLRGNDEACLQQIRRCGFDVTLLGFNEDYTPFALMRDRLLRDYASENSITCVTGPHDYTLRPLDEVVTGSDAPYSVYTPFYNRFMAGHAKKIPAPLSLDVNRVRAMLVAAPKKNFEQYVVDPAQLYTPMPMAREHGGRKEGLQRLAGVKKLKKYEEIRNDIAADQTSHLSPHIKCGTVSIREVWHTGAQEFGQTHPFLRQLVWREFYAMLAFHHPRLLQGQLKAFIGQTELVKGKKPQQNAPFQSSYDAFGWKGKPEHFAAFKEGRTGVPLVDAAVRCVNATGWCHNRCRMVIANFAVKVLAIDWRDCERWFATVAVDYDVANNNGGWLWSSGQGADAQPFFRTFNAFRQSERFDPECKFIYQWVPELAKVPPRVVHQWETYCTSSKSGRAKKGEKLESYATDYPEPIVDIKAATRKVIEAFQSYRKAKSD